MKKFLIVFLTGFILTSISFATCPKDDNPCQKPKEQCSKCQIDDDEYCVYNECFFNKQFIKMKKALCLTRQQEVRIDVLYKNFKAEAENQCCKYKTEKNKLLEMIECNNDCWKEQRKVIKEIVKESKQKAKNFKESVKDELCKNQYGEFRRFQREEKRKIKRIIKYGKIVKFPCVDCCKQ